jgi:hypothetical protein
MQTVKTSNKSYVSEKNMNRELRIKEQTNEVKNGASNIKTFFPQNNFILKYS